MSKQTFKKLDRVFCISNGWGVINHVNDNNVYSLNVRFDNDENGEYTKEGKYCTEFKPTLSFAEYSLFGFTQQRPEKKPIKGQVVWVRDGKDDKWNVNHFVSYVRLANYPYVCSPDNDESNLITFKFLTTINPYDNEQQ